MKLLLIPPIVLFLGACSSLTTVDIQRAEQFCLPNGGMTQVDKFRKTVKAQCSNTGVFKFRTNEATR